MKNFREEQVNSTNQYCINQYWEKDVIIDGITITFYYWRRKEGCNGFNGKSEVSKIEGIKNNKKKRILSIWDRNLGEKHCIELMVNKFK